MRAQHTQQAPPQHPLQQTTEANFDLHRCSGPLNGTSFDGGTVTWQWRDYGVSPLVAGSSALAGSFWFAIKATPADVADIDPAVLDLLRNAYVGGYDSLSAGCVVEVCRTPGIDLDALITTCLLDPGAPRAVSRTEQSSGCKRKVIRMSDYNHSLPAVAQQYNVSMMHLTCWNSLTNLDATPRFIIVPCPEDLIGFPTCPAYTQYNSTCGRWCWWESNDDTPYIYGIYIP